MALKRLVSYRRELGTGALISREQIVRQPWKMDKPETLQTSEEATRQQGGLFFRENSSNGGKAIRTFWRNTKFGKIRCQGQNSLPISHYLGISYRGYSSYNTHPHIRHIFALMATATPQSAIKSAS